MLSITGKISVIQADSQGNYSALVDYPELMVPSPGEYILAYNPLELDTPLAHCLFSVGLEKDIGRQTTSLLGPIPSSWTPGISLVLRGPMGNGFTGYCDTPRLAIATFSNSLFRLLPIIKPALNSGADVVVFLPENMLPADLPVDIEIHSIQLLHESLSWATLLLLEIPLTKLPQLRTWLKLSPHETLPCPAEALILTPMPCATLGDCGVCAVPSKNGRYHFACKDGPVFRLNELDW